MKKKSLKSLQLNKKKISKLGNREKLFANGGSGFCRFTPDITETIIGTITYALDCNSKDCSFDEICNPNSDAAGGASCHCEG